MAKQSKSRYWIGLVYPESAIPDWIEQLQQTGLPIAISPLHDMDEYEGGKIKKPHYHVILCWDGPTTNNVADEVLLSIGGTRAQRCLSVRGAYDYHVHLHNPEKHPYDEADRVLLNGFDVNNYAALTNQEEIMLKKYIIAVIKSQDIFEYCDLIDYLDTDDLQAYDYCTSHTLYFNTYLNSKRNKLKNKKVFANI